MTIWNKQSPPTKQYTTANIITQSGDLRITQAGDQRIIPLLVERIWDFLTAGVKQVWIKGNGNKSVWGKPTGDKTIWS